MKALRRRGADQHAAIIGPEIDAPEHGAAFSPPVGNRPRRLREGELTGHTLYIRGISQRSKTQIRRLQTRPEDFVLIE